MKDEKAPENNIILSGVSNNEITCPFCRGGWKRVGDALVFFMFFGTPFLFLLALLIT